MTNPNPLFGYEESGLPLGSTSDGKLPIPHADEAIDLLSPVAERCVCLLAAAAPGVSDQAAFAIYIQSVDAARQVPQRRTRIGSVNVDAVAARLEIPAINETLPLLSKAFEDCLSLWDSPRNLMFTMSPFSQLGARQYMDIGIGGMTPAPPLFDS